MIRIATGSLVAFRIAFGALLVILVARYFVHGWIETQFYDPEHFFTWTGFHWVKPWPRPWMEIHFAILGFLGACIALGFFYRLSAALFCLGFAYVHLIDKSNYLNHYYLIILITGLLAFLPLGRAGSLDVRLGRTARLATFPAWALWLLRFQVGVVYFFAGVAKLQPDWLFRAQPLRLWFSQTDLPFLHHPEVAFACSWAAALLDLSAPFLLLVQRTRLPTMFALVGFHVTTAFLFPIGLFPWVMLVCLTLFCEPGWPQRCLSKAQAAMGSPCTGEERYLPLSARLALGVFVLAQLVVPLRCYVYGSDVLWSEKGFRYSWRVMLIDKVAIARFYERNPNSGETRELYPENYFTSAQVHFMKTQPDMIRDFARIVQEKNARERGQIWPIFGDVSVSLNGHPVRRMLDPTIDLGADDGYVSAMMTATTTTAAMPIPR